MLWRTPRELHGRGAIFMARSWRGPGEIKILQGRSACKTQTDPRNPGERLRGVEPARHCKGGQGEMDFDSRFLVCVSPPPEAITFEDNTRLSTPSYLIMLLDPAD